MTACFRRDKWRSMNCAVRITPGNTITPIAEMPPYHFWFQFSSIGLTGEEIDEAIRTADEKKKLEIETATTLAMNSLKDAIVPGIQTWMSQQRAMC